MNDQQSVVKLHDCPDGGALGCTVGRVGQTGHQLRQHPPALALVAPAAVLQVQLRLVQAQRKGDCVCHVPGCQATFRSCGACPLSSMKFSRTAAGMSTVLSASGFARPALSGASGGAKLRTNALMTQCSDPNALACSQTIPLSAINLKRTPARLARDRHSSVAQHCGDRRAEEKAGHAVGQPERDRKRRLPSAASRSSAPASGPC